MTQSPVPKQNPTLTKPNPKVHDFKARFGVVPEAPPPKMTRLQARRAKRKRFRAGMIAFSVMLGVAGGSAFLIAQDFQGFAKFFKSTVAAVQASSDDGPVQQAATGKATEPLKKSSTAVSPVLMPEQSPPAAVAPQPVQTAAAAAPPLPSVAPEPEPPQQPAPEPVPEPVPEPAPAVVPEAATQADSEPVEAAAAEEVSPAATEPATAEPAMEAEAPVAVPAAPEPAAEAPPTAVAAPVPEKLVFPASPVVASDGTNLNASSAAAAQPAAAPVPEPDGVVVQPAAAPPETQVAMAAPPAAEPPAMIKPKDSAALVQGQVFRDCENCPDLVVVVPPAGLPAEQVARVKRPADAPPLTAFAIGRFEVTFDDWARCMAGGGCTSQPADEGWGRNTRPVINVSHDDAVNQYIAWLSRVTGATYRLPSASEWDFAEASGGVVPASGVPLIDSQTICQSGNYVAAAPSSQEAGCGDGFPATAPAGSFKANSLGLSDMRGNVWEWVSDCWTPGFTYKVKDSERDCRKRLLRGGSWTSRALLSSTPARGFEDALRASKSIGFRVARALP